MQSHLSRFVALGLVLLVGGSIGCGGGGGQGGPGGGDVGGPAAFLAPLTGAFECSGPYGYDASRLPGNPCHFGVDLRTVNRTDKSVVASADGVVARATTTLHPDYGYLVILYHGVFLGLHTYTLYAHLSGYATGVALGQEVTQGQVIGFAGTTGGVPEHLHFEFIRSATEIPWNPEGTTLGVPGTEGRVDPTLWVAGFGDATCASMGFPPGECGGTEPPAGPPGEFSHTAFSASGAPTEAIQLSLSWSESTGATGYEVLQYYYPQLYYNPPGGTLTGVPSVISPILGSGVRTYNWSLPRTTPGTYFFKVRASNANGLRISDGLDGTVVE